MCPRCSKAVQQLLQVGSKSHSAALVQVGTAMEALTNLLKQLIGRLEDELAAETSHHEWCETEKATSAAAKTEREKNIEELTAEIDQLTTKIQQLTSEITFLHSELVRVQQETDAAIQIRKDEKVISEVSCWILVVSWSISAVSSSMFFSRSVLAAALVAFSISHHSWWLVSAASSSSRRPMSCFRRLVTGAMASGSKNASWPARLLSCASMAV